MSRMLNALRKLFRAKQESLPRTISLGERGFDLIVIGLPAISVHWHEVTRISTYKHDLFAVDSVCLLFELAGERSVEVWEEDDGFRRLADHLRDYFNEVPIDWYEEVLLPPFASNARVLYERHQSSAA